MSGTIANGTMSSGTTSNTTTPAPALTGTALDHVLAYLLPLFLRGTQGDEPLARRAACQLLECYGAVTDSDFLLAAEVVAFSFTTLDNLGQSMADPAMSITTRLRLRSNANALSRAGDRNRKTLERGKQAGAQTVKRPTQTAAQQPQTIQPQTVQPQTVEPQPLQPQKPLLTTPESAIQKVRDAIVEAAPALAETLANRGQTLSRQQRRFIERKAEQARVAEARQARKLARLVPCATVPA